MDEHRIPKRLLEMRMSGGRSRYIDQVRKDEERRE
jgi:hypothetical protein